MPQADTALRIAAEDCSSEKTADRHRGALAGDKPADLDKTRFQSARAMPLD